MKLSKNGKIINMNKIEKTLEIEKIRESLIKLTKTPIAKERIETLKPSSNFDYINLEYNKLKEMMEIISTKGELPIKSELNIYDEIEYAKKGNIFDELKLNLIKSEIQNTAEVIRFSMMLDYDLKYLNQLFFKLKADEFLYGKIIATISLENTVKDSASENLASIRRRIVQLNKDIHHTLTKLLGKYSDRLNGENFVIRNGRYAIPINSSYKASVEGIVQDISDSGQTTFIEPKEVLALENELSIFQIKEKDEVNKILSELTDLVVARSDQLIQNNEVIGELDFISSKAKYAKEIDGSIPQINKHYYMNLLSARHPLIEKEICVPNDFRLGKDKTLMIISGPNAGGKTIALKTVATLCYMVKLGLPISADQDSEVPIFDKIYAEIGDYQSIESNLSTFSGHISNLSVVFQYISSKDLVVIDELCNGTDPREGESLSVAIAKFLIKKNVCSLISSHYPLLKKFGFTNDKVLNASFLFNEKTVTPTFKILLGVSGKSYGFLISKKFGLDQSIIDDARLIYDKSFETESDKKIAKIDEKERYLLQKEEKLKARQESLANLREDLNKRDKELRDKENKIKSQKIDKFDAFLNSKYNEVINIYEDFKKDNDFKKAESRLDKINVKKKKNENIELNDYVEIKQLGIKGRVTRMNGHKVEITSNDGISYKATKDLCEKIETPKEKIKTSMNIDNFIMNAKNVSHSLNLVGYHLDEGIAALDKYLDDCVLRGLKNVKVIHGFGSGQLKKAIHEYLKTKSNVKNYRLGNELDGGAGSTVIELK